MVEGVVVRREGSILPALVVGVPVLVRIDVAAFAVEVHLAILLAHVDLELARGATALPLVVAVPEAEVALTDSAEDAAPRSRLHIQVAAERSTELRQRIDLVAEEKAGEGDQQVDGGQVLRFDLDWKREEHERHVTVEHSECNKQAEDP